MSTLTSIPGWQVYVWIVAISLPAAIDLRTVRHRDRATVSEVVLMYCLGVSGAIGMFNVVMHTVFASDVAASIGWPAGNPFQTEVGFAGLAIGTVGFACFWRYDFWLPFIIAKSGFAWGAGLTHVLDIVGTGNVASNNAGPILAWDLLLPVVMVVLYLLARPARDRVAVVPARHWSTRWRLYATARADQGPGVPSAIASRRRELTTSMRAAVEVITPIGAAVSSCPADARDPGAADGGSPLLHRERPSPSPPASG